MDEKEWSLKGDEEKKQVIMAELSHGRELAMELRLHLNASSSDESREVLMERILNCFHNSISLLSDPHFKHSSHHNHFLINNKSNGNIEKWKEQMEVMRIEDDDDGFTWRKYGQKDILGAKFPRSYYRCTYRLIQGCFATKHVQRSDKDPNIYDITYQGRHTCNPDALVAPQPPSCMAPPSSEIHEPPQRTQSPKILFNFEADIKVISENLETPFHFPSTIPNENDANNFNFHTLTTLDNKFYGKFSTPFVTSTSDSTYFPMSLTRMRAVAAENTIAKSELEKIVYAATSSGELELDKNFTFDKF